MPDDHRKRFLNGVEPIGDPYVLGIWHRDRAKLRGFAMEAATALRRLAGGRPNRRFLMFGRARSGTTLLVRLLRQIPDMHCDDEVLKFAVANPRRHLNNLAETAKAPVYGCKLLTYQMIEVQRIEDGAAFLRALREDGFSFAHIRRDTFRQCMSLSIAQKTRQYHRPKDSDYRPAKVTLDVDLFVRQIRWNQALLDYETALMGEVEHLLVDYDADLADPALHQATIDRFCAHVGAAPALVAATTKKIVPEDFSEVVVNFDALKEGLVAAGLGAVLPA